MADRPTPLKRIVVCFFNNFNNLKGENMNTKIEIIYQDDGISVKINDFFICKKSLQIEYYILAKYLVETGKNIKEANTSNLRYIKCEI